MTPTGTKGAGRVAHRISVDDEVRHRLTGMEGTVMRIFRGFVYLRFSLSDGRQVCEWFKLSGFAQIAKAERPHGK